MSILTDTEEVLFGMKNEKYAVFMQKLVPDHSTDHFIGIKTPELKKLAKEMRKRSDTDEFLSELPHRYFEEDQLHAFIISEEKDFSRCIALTEAFLPYVDNWATCDQLCPKVFAKHRSELIPYVDKWISSGLTYSIRFAIGVLMRHFLGESFLTEYADRVTAVISDEYYINMMRAWYFATALAKNYDEVIPYIEQKCLDKWTHNKTIQKAVESFRVSDEHKQYLRTLKIKGE